MRTFGAPAGAPGDVSPSVGKDIEAIAGLWTRDKVCSVSDIAEQVQVSRPAASRAVRELGDQDLVEHRSYGYVDLTPKGQSIADRLTARHEVLYNFFREVLLFDEEWADQEACRLEHQVEDALVDRLSELSKFFTANEDLGAQVVRKLRRSLKK